MSPDTDTDTVFECPACGAATADNDDVDGFRCPSCGEWLWQHDDDTVHSYPPDLDVIDA